MRNVRAALPLIALVSVLGHAVPQVELYTRPLTDIQVPILLENDELLRPFDASQIAYMRSELDLLPAAHFRNLKNIRFTQLELGENAGSTAQLSTAEAVTIQAPGLGNRSIFLTLRSAIGAHVFLAMDARLKDQARGLFQSPQSRLSDMSIASLFGSTYRAWSTNSDGVLRGQLQTLFAIARGERPAPANRPTLDRTLFMAALYAEIDGLPFFTTPEPGMKSGERVLHTAVRTGTRLRLGEFEFVLEGDQIVGAVDFSTGPTRGEIIRFLMPYNVPQLVFDRIPRVTRGRSGECSRGARGCSGSPESPPRSGPRGDGKRSPSRVTGHAPLTYHPLLEFNADAEERLGDSHPVIHE
jgi:hypothetical protein